MNLFYKYILIAFGLTLGIIFMYKLGYKNCETLYIEKFAKLNIIIKEQQNNIEILKYNENVKKELKEKIIYKNKILIKKIADMSLCNGNYINESIIKIINEAKQ